MFIFAKEAAELLGKKSLGRDDFERLGVKVYDGPKTRGGHQLILVERDEVMKAAMNKEEKTYNNKESLRRNRFVNTVAVMEYLQMLNEKMDKLLLAKGGQETV